MAWLTIELISNDTGVSSALSNSRNHELVRKQIIYLFDDVINCDYRGRSSFHPALARGCFNHTTRRSLRETP